MYLFAIRRIQSKRHKRLRKLFLWILFWSRVTLPSLLSPALKSDTAVVSGKKYCLTFSWVSILGHRWMMTCLWLIKSGIFLSEQMRDNSNLPLSSLLFSSLPIIVTACYFVTSSITFVSLECMCFGRVNLGLAHSTDDIIACDNLFLSLSHY